MKLKNISVLERHAEKFVVVAMLLIFMAVIYFYLLNTPNMVQVGTQELPPKQIDTVILEQAKTLQQQLASSDVPEELAKLKITGYTGDFVNKVTTEMLEDQTWLAMSPSASNIESAGPSGPVQPYYVPQIPAPTVVAAKAGMGTIATEDVTAINGLAARFASDKPADTVYVSMTSTFDLGKMMTEFGMEPKNGVRPLPPEWWLYQFAIADVQMERHEMRPDGTWPKEGDADYSQLVTTVAPMPGTLAFRDLPENVTDDELQQLHAFLQETQVPVIQPPFYTLKGWRQWEPPVKLAEGELTAGEKVLELKNKIESNQRLITSFQNKIMQLQRVGQSSFGGDEFGGEEAAYEEDMSMMEDESSGGGGRAISRAPARPIVPRVDAKTRRIEQYNAMIKQKTEENTALLAEYGALTNGMVPSTMRVALSRPMTGMGMGGEEMYMEEEYYEDYSYEDEMMYEEEMMYGGPGMMSRYPGAPGVPGAAPGVQGPLTTNAPRQGPVQRVTQQQLLAALRGEVVPQAQAQQQAAEEKKPQVLGVLILDPERKNTVDLWSTDMTAKPGRTYKYRVRVGIVNPLWNKPKLAPDQAHLGKEFIVYGAWSEFTEPIFVEKMQYFFVQGGGQGRVNFSIWKFADGQWWQGDFTGIQPGDPIGGTKKVKVWDEALAAEVEKDLDMSTGAYLVDVDANFQVPVKGSNFSRPTTRILFSDDGRIQTRRMDEDRADPKLKWLEGQKELLATASIVQ